MLDRDGNRVGGSGGGSQEAAVGPGPVQGAWPFKVEEQRHGRSRRWVIRDGDGKIIFVAEQPLRW